MKISLLANVVLFCGVVVDGYESLTNRGDINGNELSRKRRASSEHLQILTKEIPPYVFYNDSIEGNDRFNGIIPELLKDLLLSLGITYTLHLSTHEYGSKLENSTWNGMIGDITHGQYDMIAAPLIVTSEREEAVDFVTPFAHLGLSVIIQKPLLREFRELHDKATKTAKNEEEVENVPHWMEQYTVFDAFSVGTWLVTTFMIILVWLFMWLMNRYNPYEHGWLYENGMGNEDDARLFNLTGSLWFVIGTLQFQGYDRRPQSLANRSMSCFWMCFVLLTIISYIASSANQLFWVDSVKQDIVEGNPIRDLNDLITSHEGYDYGVVRGGPALTYLENAKNAVWAQQLLSHIKGSKKRLLDDVETGFTTVKKKRFALIIEDTIARYEMSKIPCDLFDTRVKLGHLSYAFALKPGSSELKEKLSKETLTYIETDAMQLLENRWFEEHPLCSTFGSIFESTEKHYNFKSPGRITHHEYWSVLLIVIIGLVCSTIVAGIEIFQYKYKGRYRSTYFAGGNFSTDES